MGVAEVCQRLGVDRAEFAEMRRRGVIGPPTDLPGVRPRWTRADVEAAAAMVSP